MPNPEFNFTLSQLLVGIISVCGGITGIAAAITVVIKFDAFLKKPNHDQDVKIKELEEKTAKLSGEVDALKDMIAKEKDHYMELFKRDKDHLDLLDNNINMLLRGTFALLGHDLNGNNVDQMQKAFDDIQGYLFNR